MADKGEYGDRVCLPPIIFFFCFFKFTSVVVYLYVILPSLRSPYSLLAKAGRGNNYLGADEPERSLARSLVYGVSDSSEHAWGGET